MFQKEIGEVCQFKLADEEYQSVLEMLQEEVCLPDYYTLTSIRVKELALPSIPRFCIRTYVHIPSAVNQYYDYCS